MQAADPSPSVSRAVLPDGAVLHVRQITAGDRELLSEVFERLSADSRYRRFLHPVKELTEHELGYFTEVDHHNHEALVAADPHSSHLVGVARYIRTARPETAEAAIAVADDWQGRGVGTVLLHELAERARECGIRRFSAICLADNRGVIDLLRGLGPARVDHPGAGLVEITVDLPDKVLPDGELYAALRHVAAGRVQAQPVRVPSRKNKELQ